MNIEMEVSECKLKKCPNFFSCFNVIPENADGFCEYCDDTNPCPNFTFCCMRKEKPLDGLCEYCEFWSHQYCYLKKYLNERSSSSTCMFCNQVSRQPILKMNLTYINEQVLEYKPPETASQIEAGTFLSFVDQAPCESADNWTFYLNYQLHKETRSTRGKQEPMNLNIKLADCVFIAQGTTEELEEVRKKGFVAPVNVEELNPYAYAMRINYIVQDKSGVYISGQQFYSVQQMKEFQLRRPKNRLVVDAYFKSIEKHPKQMILVKDLNSWAPMKAVSSKFSLLDKSTYESNARPTGVGESDVFLSMWMYDIGSGQLEKLMHDIYERCYNPLYWRTI